MKYIEKNEIVSIKEWIIMYIVLMIPIVNIMMLFIWAFTKSEKKSKSNLAKSILIISFAVPIIIALIVVAVILNVGIPDELIKDNDILEEASIEAYQLKIDMIEKEVENFNLEIVLNKYDENPKELDIDNLEKNLYENALEESDDFWTDGENIKITDSENEIIYEGRVDW